MILTVGKEFSSNIYFFKFPGVKMDLNELSQQKQLFLETLESNLKDLQEAETLAATQPESITGN